MRGAHCWTDHRLIVTKLLLRLRRLRRSIVKKPARLKVDTLKNRVVREKYAKVLSEKILPVNETGDISAAWGTLLSHLVEAASATLGRKGRHSEDRFDDNSEALRAAFDKRSELLRQQNQRGGNVAVVKESDKELRRLSRQIKDKWWQDKACRKQWLADTNQLGQFYCEVRKLIGTSYQAKVPLRSLDGIHLVTSKEVVLKRWAEHFNHLLNVDRSADLHNISLLSQLPLSTELDKLLSCDEVVAAITQQHNKRSVGIDLIPGELLKYGGMELHTAVWKRFVRMWEKERDPDDFKVSH